MGVVGYGGAYNMGKKHLEEMQKAGMTPIAVAEPDESRLAVARQDFPSIETYASLKEMLKKSPVNLLAIITPHNTHAPLALQCLKAGRHVVCEKPFAITTAEVDQMIALARKNKLMISTYHNRHWDGWIIDAVELIKKQKIIGDIVRIEGRMGTHMQPADWWRSSRSISGGVLYDWGVHLIEQSLQLIETPATEVSGFSHTGYWAPKTKWRNDCIEDEATAVIRFQSGQRLTITISNIECNPRTGLLEITGTEGSYVIDWHHRTVIKRRDGVISTEQSPHSPDKHYLYYENVRDHLIKGAPLVISAEWSRRPIHYIEKAIRSAKLGRALPLKYG